MITIRKNCFKCNTLFDLDNKQKKRIKNNKNSKVFCNINCYLEYKKTGKMNRDKSRIAYLKKCGFNLFIIWEKDIKENENNYLNDVIDYINKLYNTTETCND